MLRPSEQRERCCRRREVEVEPLKPEDACHAADDAIRNINKVGPGSLLARPLKLPSSDEILASARLDLVLILRCSKATALYSNIKCELTDLEME
jgi:hypothetical protein